MESPLSFNSSENFRKKLLLRNLKPYKIENNFSTNETFPKQEITIKDFSVIDSPNIDDIGNREEKKLYPLNKYGPQNTKQTYGDTVFINLNLNTQTNFGEYGYSDSINSKLEKIGEAQEQLLYVKNLYGPLNPESTYGVTVDINSISQVNSNLGVYGYSSTINSKLEQIGNTKENDLIVKNPYKPESSNNGYGDTKWSINNDLVIFTFGEGEYTKQDANVSLLGSIGGQQQLLLKVKNVYKTGGSLFGAIADRINDDLLVTTTGEGTYGLEDTYNNLLEQRGNQQEILLRVLNKYNPNNGNDFGETKFVNFNYPVIPNQGEYGYTDLTGSRLEIIGINTRNLIFPLSQYGPEGNQSTQPVLPSVNLPISPNEGNYSYTDSIGSSLELIGDKQEIFLRVKNKYNPNNGNDFGETKNINFNYPVVPNQGEYDLSDTNGSKLETDGLIEANDAYVINKYVSGDGSYPVIAEIPDEQILTTGERYYNSAQSFVFLPSEYSPVSILTSDDPSGSNGSLSQDSALAGLAAKQLKKEFKYRVAAELLSETIGRVNALESSVDPDSGEISVKPKLDPFNAVGIISGNIPLFKRNYVVTSPDLAIGKAINFAAKLAGLYSPYSIIPDEYFDYPKPRLLNQLIENPVGLVTNSIMGAIRSITSPNIRKGSDLFLAYTSPATRDLLWGQIFYNEFRPDYRGNSLRNPNLFSPKPNYYIGTRKTTINDIVSPVKDLPEYKEGKPMDIAVYGFGEVAKEYEGEKLSQIFFGLNTRNFFDGNNSITSNFSWTTKKSFFQPGAFAGKQGKQEFKSSAVFEANIKKQFNDSQSFNNEFKEGSLLDITQKIVDAGSRQGVKILEHVGNAINQVAKVFNDGTMELTKGSRVIKYITKNSIDTNGKEFQGLEYCRIFTKDIPYYTLSQLQKTDGNIRKFGYSVFDNTYNLNIAPMNDKNGQSTNIVNGKVKKYMFSLENLAWRTSNKPGFTVDDLPACEKGPNGGRIMWFPPYDLTFDDTTKADFTGVEFLGRPESIYTYKNSSRSGSISWSILVDHPSITDLLIDQELKNITPESEVTKIMDSFFAGCLKYDLYELAKKYVQFSPNDIQQAINEVRNAEDAKKVADETPQTETERTDETQSTIDELNDKNKEYFLFFEHTLPTADGNKFDYWYDEYLKNESNYSSKGKDIIFSYSKTKNPKFTVPTPETLTNDTADFSLKDYIDTRNSSLSDFFNDRVKSSKSTLDDFIQKVGKVLDSGGEVTFKLLGTASAAGGSSSNKALSQRRINSIREYILDSSFNEKKLRTYYDKKSLIIKEEPLGDTANNLKDEKLNDVDCSLRFLSDSNEGIYSIQAMACRRTKIIVVNVKNAKKPEKEEVINEGQEPNLNAADEGVNNTITPQPSATEVKDTPLSTGLAKKLLRKLLSECNYFEMLKNNDPFVYDGIKKKFKHFQPAFHAITPEGLNSRLTFLQQCMRPGDTIPTVTKTGAGTLDLNYKDAFNSAFGSPPVLVLRIGDFFNTKIIPDNLTIKFDKDGLFDINPEGIGLQPMYATVTLSFKFIGGSGLAGPVSKLQNALSFNYYANTEMYDERAEETDQSLKKYDAEFYEAAKLNTKAEPEKKQTNKLGITFGKVESSAFDVNGTASGKISYQKLMKDFIPVVKGYTDTVYNTLKQVNEKNSIGGLYIINTDRNYQEGFFDNIATPNVYLKKIYGKSVKYQDKIDLLFDKIKDDIEDENIPLLASLNQYNFTNSQIRKVKKQLIKMSKDRKQSYLNDIDTNANKIVNEGITKLVEQIDVLNFISNATDGYLEKGKSIIYGLTGTTEVDPSDSYPNTLDELKGDFLKAGNDVQEFIDKLIENKIITTEDNKKWIDSFNFDLNIGDGATEYDNRLNMVFGKDIVEDTGKFIDEIVSNLDNDVKNNWKNYIADNLSWNPTSNTSTSDTGIYNTYKKQKDKSKENFDNFDKYYSQKFVNYKPYNDSKKRVLNFASQVPVNPTADEALQNLDKSVDSGGDKYNLKRKFK
jgi:hypothetical protein